MTIACMTSILNVNDLISSGTHKWCPECKGAIIAVTSDKCSACASGWKRATIEIGPAKRTARTTARTPHLDAVTSLKKERLAQLSNLPDGQLWLVVKGKPVTQGSMKVAKGRVMHSSGSELRQWRDSITKEALRAVGSDWVPLDVPLRLEVVLTIPRPKTLSTDAYDCTDGFPRCAPMAPPDTDKLLRAVQDAFSPFQKKESGRRFQIVADDSRFVDSCAVKTYPAPAHTHPWALTQPGAVIRVSPLGNDLPPMPASCLDNPGVLPEILRQRATEIGLS